MSCVAVLTSRSSRPPSRSVHVTADRAIGWSVTFFESLLALLLVAVLLLQIARRASIPYPTMLAAAGVLVALVPGSPVIRIAPETALALFIAPVLIDAAYDFPLGAARKLLAPLIVYAVVAVIVTASLVALVGTVVLDLSPAAALTLGAIVAPPDAAAATAVLIGLPVARRVDAVLKGESLFNDATALLLFTTALTIQERGGVDMATGMQLALAAPGGILFGIAYGFMVRWLNPYLGNTVGATISQFVHCFLTWIIAERLHLSAVLAVVASAMTIAAAAPDSDNPRMRVHSYAVWTTIVFLLNVVAFLLMGMQARVIVAGMNAAERVQAAWFSAAVVGTAIATRLAVAFGYRWWVVRQYRRGRGEQPIARGETLIVGWAGMRGLVTLATAFALPQDFPHRNIVVLAAFAVVLATLVVQGATLAPLIRRMGADRGDEMARELEEGREALADAALERLDGREGEAADDLRRGWRALRDYRAAPAALDGRRDVALAVVRAARRRLEELRDDHRVGADAYLKLQEELDWKQLAVVSDEDRRLDEA